MNEEPEFAKLALLVLRLKLVPLAALQLGRYSKGNTLRGAFGAAFRRLVCIPQCHGAARCPLEHRCPYKTIFEPSPTPESAGLTKNQDSPRPFVLRPPADGKTIYAAGEALEFGLVLVGRAVDYLPYFVLSFRDVASSGLGAGRSRCELAEVCALAPTADASAANGCLAHGHAAGVAQTVYDARDQLFHTPQPQNLGDWLAVRFQEPGRRLSFGASPSESNSASTKGPPAARGHSTGVNGATTITVRFLTPMSLKAEGRVGVQPEFHHLFRRVRDRLSSLCTFYGPGELAADFKGLGERAETVRTLESKLTWVERSRISAKTHQRHELSGFVGSCTYQGQFDEFLPWLGAGELIGAGRHTSWGNGRFVLS